MNSIPETATTKPNKKALLLDSVGGMKLGAPVRLKHTIDPQTSETGFMAPGVPSIEPSPSSTPAEHPTRSAPILEQSGSSGNSVTPVQSQSVILYDPKAQEFQPTGSRLDSVTPCPSEDGQAVTESSPDRVTPRQSHGVNLSRASGENCPAPAATILRSGVLKPKDHYCAVPNVLLQAAGLFANTFDLAVYLHLFANSYGFGRNTCDMGLAELERFTGLARNSVKKSLERLTAAKWIRMHSDFEYSRVTRKWRVYSPYERGHTPHPTYHDPARNQDSGSAKTKAPVTTESQHDSVTARQHQEVTLRGLPRDAVTGSPRDTYKNKEEKHSLKDIPQFHSLTSRANSVQQYFSETMPSRKKEREEQAFQELREIYSEKDIAACLEEVRVKGLPGGGTCHSPMAYLAVAIDNVLPRVREQEKRERRRAEEKRQLAEQAKRETEEAAHSERAAEVRERAFTRFVAEASITQGKDESVIIAEICRNHDFALPGGLANGRLARLFAIARHWDGLTRAEQEREEALHETAKTQSA